MQKWRWMEKKGPTHLETSTLQHAGKPGNQELVFHLRLEIWRKTACIMQLSKQNARYPIFLMPTFFFGSRVELHPKHTHESLGLKKAMVWFEQIGRDVPEETPPTSLRAFEQGFVLRYLAAAKRVLHKGRAVCFIFCWWMRHNEACSSILFGWDNSVFCVCACLWYSDALLANPCFWMVKCHILEIRFQLFAATWCNVCGIQRGMVGETSLISLEHDQLLRLQYSHHCGCFTLHFGIDSCAKSNLVDPKRFKIDLKWFHP